MTRQRNRERGRSAARVAAPWTIVSVLVLVAALLIIPGGVAQDDDCTISIELDAPDGTTFRVFDLEAPVDATGSSGFDGFNRTTLNGDDQAPMGGPPYTITFPDGTVGSLTGTVDNFDDLAVDKGQQEVDVPIDCGDGDGSTGTSSGPGDGSSGGDSTSSGDEDNGTTGDTTGEEGSGSSAQDDEGSGSTSSGDSDDDETGSARLSSLSIAIIALSVLVVGAAVVTLTMRRS